MSSTYEGDMAEKILFIALLALNETCEYIQFYRAKLIS